MLTEVTLTKEFKKSKQLKVLENYIYIDTLFKPIIFHFIYNLPFYSI